MHTSSCLNTLTLSAFTASTVSFSVDFCRDQQITCFDQTLYSQACSAIRSLSIFITSRRREREKEKDEKIVVIRKEGTINKEKNLTQNINRVAVHWLPIKERIIFKIATFDFCFLDGTLPPAAELLRPKSLFVICLSWL